MSLRTRIAGLGTLAVAVTVICSAAIVYLAVRAELRGEVDESLRRTAGAVTGEGEGRDRGLGLAPGPLGGPLRRPPPSELRPPESPFGGAEGYVQLVLPDGSVTRPGPGPETSLLAEARAVALARRGVGEYLTDTRVNGLHLRVLTRGIGALGAIQVARPLTEEDRQVKRVLLVLVLIGAGGVGLALGLGMLLAHSALAPIRRFTTRTETIAASPEPSRRMEVQGDDELARLARSFNATLDALERSVEAQRHLVADASHELRTPMATLRANIQVLEDSDRLSPEERRALRADIVEELDELTSLVGDVVELARGTKLAETVEDLRLDQIVEAAAERARRRAGDGAKVEVSAEPTLVDGDPRRIDRAVSNLLDNARKWSPPGGLIQVGLSEGVLTVRDHGHGFAERDLPHVFDRFYRADDARGMPGSGLGLAIARQAAEAHGGFVEAANAPGGGAVIRIGFGPATKVSLSQAAQETSAPASPDPTPGPAR